MEEIKRQVLFNKLEYVALFKLNRPVQTMEESVSEFKKVKQEFMELIQLIECSNHARELDWANRMKEIINAEQEKALTDKKRNRHQQLQKIDRARRANRTLLADAISVVNSEYAKIKKKEIKMIQDVHTEALQEAQSRIKSLRVDIIHKHDAISKLRAHMTKMQAILRKNGLISESADAQNNSISVKTTIDALQNTIQQRNEKISSLVAQISRIKSIPKLIGRTSNVGAFTGITEVNEGRENQEEEYSNFPPLNSEDDVKQSIGSFRRDSSSLNISFNSGHHLSFLCHSNSSSRKTSMLWEKRASISLKGLQSANREGVIEEPLAAIEAKQSVEERLVEITDKYEKLLAAERSLHEARKKAELDRIEEDDAINRIMFQDQLNFSTKRLLENRALQISSIGLLDSIQGLFPLRIHPTKVSTYTQCDLDDLII